MKKFLSLLMIPVIAFSLASCGKKDDKAKKETSTTTAKPNTTLSSEEIETKTADYSEVLKDLNKKEGKLVDTFGKTEKGKKIVAFFGDKSETEFIVIEFKDGKASKASDYRFFEEDNKYEAYAILAEKNDKAGFKAYEKEKCIEQNVIKKYRNKTYDEVYKMLKSYYDFK